MQVDLRKVIWLSAISDTFNKDKHYQCRIGEVNIEIGSRSTSAGVTEARQVPKLCTVNSLKHEEKSNRCKLN
jgi:hypothetical protein